MACVGCGDSKEAPAQGAAEVQSPDGPRRVDGIEVLELGASPRQLAAWSPSAAERGLTVTLSSDLSGADGLKVAMPSLTFRGTIGRMSADAAAGAGPIVVRHVVTEAVVGADTPNPRLAVDLRAEVGKASGHTTRLEYDRQARLLDRKTTKPAQVVGPLQPALVQLGELFGVAQTPLPAVGIGVGARWRVRTVVEQGRIPLQQTATFTLLERKDAVLRIGLEFDQVLDDAAKSSGQPIESLTAHGEGEVEVSLSEVGPQRAELSTRVSMTRGGARGSTKVELNLRAQIEAAGGSESELAR